MKEYRKMWNQKKTFVYFGFSSFQDKSTRIYNEKRIPSITILAVSPGDRRCSLAFAKTYKSLGPEAVVKFQITMPFKRFKPMLCEPLDHFA